ncbi:MAG TPA: HlyD family efflux transporter periplasmic adaptor subunit [Clostridia bacterium]|nr:HlyD family efflux transporter periplasmic adaptor subunit [Clostridia bacterium]
MKRKWLGWTGAAAATVLLALWMLFGFGAPLQPFSWPVWVLQPDQQTRTVRAEGQLEYALLATVYAQTEGTVRAVYYAEGDLVAMDEVLAVLTNEELESRLQETSDALYALQVELSSALVNAAEETVVSPVSGRVAAMEAREGDAFADGAMAVIAANNAFDWTGSVPDAAGFFLGQAVRLLSGDASYDGQVVSLEDGALAVRVQGAALQAGQTLMLETGEDTEPVSGVLSMAMPATIWGTAGVIRSVHARSGDWVEAGDPLFTLQTPVTWEGLESRLLEYEQLQRSLTAARSRMESLVLPAPTQGVITDFSLIEGAHIQAGQAVASIAQSDFRKATLYVREEEIASVKPGLTATVTLAAFPGQSYETYVDAVADQGTRLSDGSYFAVTLHLPYVEGMLNGMSVSGEIQVGQREQQLLVPVSSVVEIQGQPCVLRAPDASELPRSGLRGPLGRLLQPSAEEALRQLLPSLALPVQLGEVWGDRVAVVSGVAAGQTIQDVQGLEAGLEAIGS